MNWIEAVAGQLVLLLALLVVPPQRGCKPQFAPLDTGRHVRDSILPSWTKEQAGEWGGTGWLGWAQKGETLEPVRLVVRDVPQRFVGDEDEVAVERPLGVDYAVRCISGLRAGAIHNAGIDGYELDRERPLRVSLGKRRYELRLQTARADLVDARVILSDGRRSQVLYSVGRVPDDPHFGIAWAGDLDRDEKLDLIVNLSRKYTDHPYRLLLSSKATGGQLVGEAALFQTGD